MTQAPLDGRLDEVLRTLAVTCAGCAKSAA